MFGRNPCPVPIREKVKRASSLQIDFDQFRLVGIAVLLLKHVNHGHESVKFAAAVFGDKLLLNLAKLIVACQAIGWGCPCHRQLWRSHESLPRSRLCSVSRLSTLSLLLSPCFLAAPDRYVGQSSIESRARDDRKYFSKSNQDECERVFRG